MRVHILPNVLLSAVLVVIRIRYKRAILTETGLRLFAVWVWRCRCQAGAISWPIQSASSPTAPFYSREYLALRYQQPVWLLPWPVFYLIANRFEDGATPDCAGGGQMGKFILRRLLDIFIILVIIFCKLYHSSAYTHGGPTPPEPSRYQANKGGESLGPKSWSRCV